MIASLERARYQGWDAWSVRHGPLELLLVPEVGGRVMGVRWREHELTFTQPERRGLVEDVSAVADIHERKRMMGFALEEREAVFDVAGWPRDEPAVRRLVEQARRGSA